MINAVNTLRCHGLEAIRILHVDFLAVVSNWEYFVRETFCQNYSYFVVHECFVEFVLAKAV